MTLVKFKNGLPLDRTFNHLFEDLFEGIPNFVNEEKNRGKFKGLAAVNIKELENYFQLDLIAPGFEKSDFQVKIEKNLLTISVEKKQNENTDSAKNIRSEYMLNSFSRSFTLDDKIDHADIEANYLNGILVLNLPKKPEVKEAAKQISVK